MPMETIRVLIDAELLHEVDEAARRAGVSRSEFICKATNDYAPQGQGAES
jgi:metal-responsive CopG/Arc/MetJ family transcriptional regulator